MICDRLTKFVHLLALPSKYTTKDLASRFTVEIFRLHGVPKSIIFDRDPLFVSQLWKEFFKLQGTTLKYSLSYHPQTDGQTEVVNRSLEVYLRCFVNEIPRHWYKFLHLAEYWYNTSLHSTINMTPFRALYDRDPPSLLDYVAGSTQDNTLDLNLQQHQQILRQLKANFERSKISMEKQSNKHRIDFTFKVGDLVLLKLQPYRQSIVAKRVSHKLSKRLFGPYRVIRRIGAFAYMLDLPSSSQIHPVVHVSMLRPYFRASPSSGFTPPPAPDLTSYIYQLTEAELSRDNVKFDAFGVSKFSEKGQE